MRFSCAIAFALVAACASSVSALPTDTNIGICPIFCSKPADCSSCIYTKCVSFSVLCPGFDYTTHRHGRLSLHARRDVAVLTWCQTYSHGPMQSLKGAPDAGYARKSWEQISRDSYCVVCDPMRQILIVGGLECFVALAYAILRAAHASRSVQLR